MKYCTLLLIINDKNESENIKQQLNTINNKHFLHIVNKEVDALSLLTIDTIDADIILLDTDTPYLNGIEFLRIIKSYHSFKNIKIFILTSSEESFEKIAMQNLGVDGYILKPLNLMNTTSPGIEKLLHALTRC